jgi:hypothetical protein
VNEDVLWFSNFLQEEICSHGVIFQLMESHKICVSFARAHELIVSVLSQLSENPQLQVKIAHLFRSSYRSGYYYYRLDCLKITHTNAYIFSFTQFSQDWVSSKTVAAVQQSMRLNPNSLRIQTDGLKFLKNTTGIYKWTPVSNYLSFSLFPNLNFVPANSNCVFVYLVFVKKVDLVLE